MSGYDIFQDRIKRLENEVFGITQEQSTKLSGDFYEAVGIMDGIRAGVRDLKEGRIRPWEEIEGEIMGKPGY